MHKKSIVIAVSLIAAFGGISGVMAQNVPGHPGVNEVDQRLLNQQRRIDAGVNQGQIGARGAARDSAVDARVARQLSRDQAQHNGHVTAAEYHQMNRELNQNSRRIYNQRHQ